MIQAEFGAFLSQLRKEKGLTQKQLAEALFVSDKAVYRKASKKRSWLADADAYKRGLLSGLINRHR